ncbi:MAG: hypothetical protein BWZ10_01824 [candidate division BRC1 bacterium ADurb.BinA364]|nr:MAG: hypothetical protein BWZ10_01824 [candidate division BRC1 bacterium ADurb.BinA364]
MLQPLDGGLVLALLVKHPAHGIEDVRRVGRQLQRPLDQLAGFVEPHAARSVEIAQIVQRFGIVGLEFEKLAVDGVGLGDSLRRIVEHAKPEIRAGKARIDVDNFAIRFFRIARPTGFLVQRGQRKQRIDALRSGAGGAEQVFQHGFGFAETVQGGQRRGLADVHLGHRRALGGLAGVFQRSQGVFGLAHQIVDIGPPDMQRGALALRKNARRFVQNRQRFLETLFADQEQNQQVGVARIARTQPQRLAHRLDRSGDIVGADLNLRLGAPEIGLVGLRGAFERLGDQPVGLAHQTGAAIAVGQLGQHRRIVRPQRFGLAQARRRLGDSAQPDEQAAQLQPPQRIAGVQIDGVAQYADRFVLAAIGDQALGVQLFESRIGTEFAGQPLKELRRRLLRFLLQERNQIFQNSRALVRFRRDERLSIHLDGVVQPAAAFVQPPQHQLRRNVARIDGDGLIVARFGLLDLAFGVVNQGQLQQRQQPVALLRHIQRILVERDGGGGGLGALGRIGRLAVVFVPAQLPQGVQGAQIARLDLARFLVLLERGQPVFVVQIAPLQRLVAGGKGQARLDGFGLGRDRSFRFAQGAFVVAGLVLRPDDRQRDRLHLRPRAARLLQRIERGFVVAARGEQPACQKVRPGCPLAALGVGDDGVEPKPVLVEQKIHWRKMVDRLDAGRRRLSAGMARFRRRRGIAAQPRTGGQHRQSAYARPGPAQIASFDHPFPRFARAADFASSLSPPGCRCPAGVRRHNEGV